MKHINWFIAARTAKNPIGSYSLAGLFVLSAVALQLLIQDWLGQTVLLLLYPAVFLAAWLLGTGPGILASALGAVAAIFFFSPVPTLHAPSLTEMFRVAVFFAAGSILAVLMGRGRQAEARLRESEERFRLLVLALTHDLKTPLTVAKSSAELLLRFPDREDLQRTTIPRILTSIQRVERMIQDILDANRVELGQELAISRRRSDLSAELATAAEEMRVVHGERLVFSAPQTLIGDWDAGALRRCVENLINNAAKYGHRDSPITVTMTPYGAGARIEVHNEGEPIPENEQQRLFSAYHRSKSATTSGVRGWGIGLTLVKGLVEAHKGSIHVVSRAGFGTSFIIEIPEGLEQKSAA